MLQSNSLASFVIAVIITLTLQAACSTDMSAGYDHNINMRGSSGSFGFKNQWHLVKGKCKLDISESETNNTVIFV